MSEKKVVSRNIAIVIGVICIVLVAALIAIELDYKYDVIQLKNYNHILGMNFNAYTLRENEFD
jgi:hypothetical protein